MKNRSNAFLAVSTVAVLGGLGAIAYSAGSADRPATQPAAVTTEARPRIKTIVERRTVYITRHAKRPAAAAPPAPAAATASPAAVQQAPAQRASVQQPLRPRAVLVTHASPAAGEREHEDSHDDGSRPEPGDD